MKIVHVGLAHSAKDSRILYKECVSLARAGYDVYYLTSDCNGKEKFVYEKVKVATIFNSTNPYRVIQFFKYIKKKKEVEKKYIKTICMLHPDIIHVHEYALIGVIKKLHHLGYKIIYDIHEDNPGETYNYMKNRHGLIIALLLKFYTKYRENKIIRKIEYTVVATDFLRKKIKKISSKCQTIYNYPILEEGKPFFVEKENVICFAGGVSKQNGIKMLIDIVNEVECNLLLAGKMENEIDIYIKQNNKKNLIHYLGVLDRDEVWKIYQKSKIGVDIDLPFINNINALPIKMFEFMNAGLPVITSNFPERRKIIEESHCGILVDPLNKKEIIEKMRELIGDEDLMKLYGENGRRAVEKVYNWANEEKKLLCIYEKILWKNKSVN